MSKFIMAVKTIYLLLFFFQLYNFNLPFILIFAGKELGLGKFGVVYKADAIGMINDVSTTTVSVKMAKSNTDQTHINALRSELDIMIHIGMHLNIVNLLGAYTGSINRSNKRKKNNNIIFMKNCRSVL